MQDGTHDHVRSYHLHRLATALDTVGFHATVKTSYPAALHVSVPGASMLAESIDCTPGTDDDGRLCWYYRWSWGEVLARRRGSAGRSGENRRGARRAVTAHWKRARDARMAPRGATWRSG